MSDSAAESVFRILLVEDAPDQSLLLSALLQKLGPFDVTLVQDGVQALDLARRDPFDLVLTDLNLPGMDGFELTRELKAALPRLPVLAATGYTDANYVEGAYRAGVDALMTKPVDPEDLEARLRELLPRWHAVGGARAPSVIAVGARPGDVELGCGASLAAHESAGHDVLMFIVSAGQGGEQAADRARKAAEQLGVRLIVADATPAGAEPRERRLLLERLVAEMKPTWAYLPSLADRDPHRREAHRLAAPAIESVPTVLGYATATSTLAFAPSVYRDVQRWMDSKLSALAYHQAGRATEPGLSPDFALAQARYWGRFKDFGEIEPFELLGGGAPEAPPAEEAEPVAEPAAMVEPVAEPVEVPETVAVQPEVPEPVAEQPVQPTARRMPPPPVMPPKLPGSGHDS